MRTILVASAILCNVGCATTLRLDVYPQDTPEATLRSVVRALSAEEYSYFADHLYDPLNREVELKQPGFNRRDWLCHIRKVSEVIGADFHRECLTVACCAACVEKQTPNA